MVNKKADIFEYITLLIIGAVIYCAIELVWRGYTHWSMAVAGGVSLSALGGCRKKLIKHTLTLRCIAGAGIITAVEFIAGCIVNLWLNWAVWDYSKLKFNILGQVCPQFFLMWILLSIPAYGICRLVGELRTVYENSAVPVYK